MKQSILNLGKVLTKQQLQKINGGYNCNYISDTLSIKVTDSEIIPGTNIKVHKVYIDGKYSRTLSGNIEAKDVCDSAAILIAFEGEEIYQ